MMSADTAKESIVHELASPSSRSEVWMETNLNSQGQFRVVSFLKIWVATCLRQDFNNDFFKTLLDWLHTHCKEELNCFKLMLLKVCNSYS